MQQIVFSKHALFQMQRRGISEADVIRVIEGPGQTHEVRAGRVVYQAKHSVGGSAEASLVRVFVDVDAECGAS